MLHMSHSMFEVSVGGPRSLLLDLRPHIPESTFKLNRNTIMCVMPLNASCIIPYVSCSSSYLLQTSSVRQNFLQRWKIRSAKRKCSDVQLTHQNKDQCSEGWRVLFYLHENLFT